VDPSHEALRVELGHALRLLEEAEWAQSVLGNRRVKSGDSGEREESAVDLDMLRSRLCNLEYFTKREFTRDANMLFHQVMLSLVLYLIYSSPLHLILSERRI
jgi:hypothetical protein